MKILIIFLMTIFSSEAFAGNGSANVSSITATCGAPYQTNGTYSVQGQQIAAISDSASVVTLVGNAISTTAGRYYGFYSMNQASGSGNNLYQVPNGKTFYAVGISLTSGVAGQGINVGWGTAAIASEGTASPPTGENNYSPSSTIYPITNVATVSTGFTFHPIIMSYPSQSYPFWKAGTSSTNYYVFMCGYVQ